MLFNSLHFLLFFPVVMLIYFVLPYRLRFGWLLLASYYFYISWNPKYSLLLAASTIVTYVSGILIARSNNIPNDKTRVLQKKLWVTLSLLLNLTILFFFKYASFAINNINSLLSNTGVRLLEPGFDILLPVGISFYIFQALGYTIDVYRGDTAVEKNFIQYALFVSYFPQLVAGPIERSGNLLTQLQRNHDFKYKQAASGLKLMAIGLFKKMLIADIIASYVNSVYNNVYDYTGIPLLIATFLFSVQIYCDFSAYSDIAIGASRILGIELMTNFNTPYFATSIKDFWRRWHISLSTWFRDYLYIPLGGNKRGTLIRYRNILITFIVSGLWHGASWTFVIWGGIHGAAQLIEDVVIAKLQKTSRRKAPILLRWVTTQIVVMLAWIFFRANTVSDAIYVVLHMFRGFSSFRNYFRMDMFDMTTPWMVMFLTPMALLVLHDYGIYKQNDLIDALSRRKMWLRWTVYYLLISFSICYILLFSLFSVQEFIYFQF